MPRSRLIPTQKEQPETAETSRERALSTQIDLLVMSVLVIGAFSVFVIFGLGLVDDIRALSPDDEIEVDRNIEIIANDYLVADANDATLETNCVESFFSKAPSASCGQSTGWSDDTYLEDALYLTGSNSHLRIESPSAGGPATLPSGTELSVGDSIDQMDKDVTQQSLYVSLDVDSDGIDELLRLTLYVW